MGQRSLPLIESVKAVDEVTVRFKTKGPDPVFAERWASYGTGVVSKAAFEAAKDFETWVRQPVATGPFRVVEVKENDFILLEAHDAYWGGKPNIKSIKFQMVPELSARIAGLLAGDYDIITTVSPDQIETIESAEGFDVVGGDSMHYRTLVYDVANNPILADVNLRRAMNLAIDRELLVETLWNGRISIPKGHQHPAYGGLYDAKRPIPAYDPERARDLLTQSNYKGEVIPFRTVGTYYTAELATTQVLAEMWKAVGINVDIQVKENWGQVLGEDGRGINNSLRRHLFPRPLGFSLDSLGQNRFLAGSWLLVQRQVQRAR